MVEKNSIMEHYSAILDDLIKHNAAFGVYFQDPSRFYDMHVSYNFDGNVRVKSGATRCCIVDSSYNYVVKFDIEGDELYDSACDYERMVYDEAKEEGLEQYLCRGIYLGTYERDVLAYDIDDVIDHVNMCFCTDIDYLENDLDYYDDQICCDTVHISLPLYAYPRVEFTSPSRIDVMCGFTQDYINRISSQRTPLTERSNTVALTFISAFGEDEYNRFCRFLRKFRVNDLHTSNIGYLDGQFCLSDYAGYHDCCDLEDEEYDEEYYDCSFSIDE